MIERKKKKFKRERRKATRSKLSARSLDGSRSLEKYRIKGMDANHRKAVKVKKKIQYLFLGLLNFWNYGHEWLDIIQGLDYNKSKSYNTTLNFDLIFSFKKKVMWQEMQGSTVCQSIATR